MSKKAKAWDLYPWRELPESIVIGVDEVGRGCLAGPVYAAAVRMRPEQEKLPVTDSKLLSASRREELSEMIFSSCEVGLGFASVEEIASLNILRASLLAMRRAVEKLGHPDGLLLVDGNQKIPDLPRFRQATLIKGDLRAEPIAAASIVAKVARDQLMVRLDEEHPGYGFGEHKGYATAVHQEAIRRLGPSPVHRITFSGVKEFVRPQQDAQGLGR